MRRDLAAPMAAAPLPVGARLVPFGPEIAPACRELMNGVYAEGFGDAVPFELWWPKLESDSEYDPGLCFVAEHAGSIVGFCHCWTVPFVKDIVVAPEVRGRGLGAALLTTAMQAFVARGATSLDLKTDVDNIKAQSLYRRLGFEIVERVG